MRKTAAVIILIVVVIFPAAAQVSGPADIIVLLDTSSSMSDYYQQTGDYLTGPFLREFVRIGDTFHLISFSKTPRLEISRRIEGVGDVETIIGRMLLLYPLDPETDIAAALTFVEQYTASLPTNRQRKIVLVSDGDNGNQSVDAAISGAFSRLGSQGADLQFIRVPVTNAPSSGSPVGQTAQTAPQTTTSPSGQASSAQSGQTTTPGQTGSAQAASPSQQTQQSSSPSVSTTPPATATESSVIAGQQSSPQETSGNQSGTASETETQQTGGSQNETTSVTQQQSQTETSPAASSGSQTSPAVSETLPVAPSGQTQPARTQRTTWGFGVSMPMLIAIIIFILLILGIILFLILRRLYRSPNRVITEAAAMPPASASAQRREKIAAQNPDKQKDAQTLSGYAQSQKSAGAPPLASPAPTRKPMPKDKPPADQTFDNKPVMLTLFVEDQNTAIGRRNIHNVKPGTSFTVGGGNSDFLVFLVPLAPQIGEIRFDGRQCTFIPKKPKYFPDLGSQPVPNCIGRTIRVISDRDYELFIRIERYQDPLIALNKLLNSISVPGL